MVRPNFYAVKAGRMPGIYTTWASCSAQVKGFSGARFKGFATLEDARIFLDKQPSPQPSQQWRPSQSQSNIGQMVQVSPFPAGGASITMTQSMTSAVNNPDPGVIVHVEAIPPQVPQVGDGSAAQDPGEKKVSKKRSRRQMESDGTAMVLKVGDARPVPLRMPMNSNRPVKRMRYCKTGPRLLAEKPTKKTRKTKPPPSTPSIELNSSTKAFFISLKYHNPAAFANLAETGFGPHELLSMKGLQSTEVVSRFTNLLGSHKPQLAAQIESLAYAVVHATDVVWTELEKAQCVI